MVLEQFDEKWWVHYENFHIWLQTLSWALFETHVRLMRFLKKKKLVSILILDCCQLMLRVFFCHCSFFWAGLKKQFWSTSASKKLLFGKFFIRAFQRVILIELPQILTCQSWLINETLCWSFSHKTLYQPPVLLLPCFVSL